MKLSKDYDALINAQCKIIIDNENFLNDTDYKAIRASEGVGEPISEEDTQARKDARAAIRAARIAKADLEEEKRQEEEQEPIPTPEA